MMEQSRLTKIIRVDAEKPDDNLLLPAAEALRAGQLVAFPTETVYGLGANALDPEAVAAIFTAKGRPGDNPLIVHIADLSGLAPLVRTVPPLAARLFDAFAPGPVTLVLPRSPAVPDLVTAGLDTVAVRIPAHPVARRLIELAGVPVAAPSANRSGRPSPTRAWHVEHDLSGRIAYIVDAGACEYGLESTVVDVAGDRPTILRPGAITAEAVAAVAAAAGCVLSGTVQQDAKADSGQTPRSPGMKYRHYAPRARVLIAEGQNPEIRARHAASLLSGLDRMGKAIGFYGCRRFLEQLSLDLDYLDPDWHDGSRPVHGQMPAMAYGDQPDAAAAAAGLFDALRRLDQTGAMAIIAESLPDDGIGAAYMNRLGKASQAAAVVRGATSQEEPHV